jgi:CrcB protein
MDDRTGPNGSGEHFPIDPDLGPSRPGHRRLDPSVLAAVALGGLAGATARYGVNRWIPTPPGGFPWATFWVNVSGSFGLGFALVLILERFPPTRFLRPFLATGVLGAYTTMSTYQVETAVLVKDGHVATASLYAAGSILAGLAAAYLGVLSGRLSSSRSKEARA